jgi:hypothetical protein
MKTFAHFDAEGAIQSLVTVDGPENVDGGLVPAPGMFVDEVEGVDLKPNELDVEAARQFVERQRVAPVSSSPRKLVEKRAD